MVRNSAIWPPWLLSFELRRWWFEAAAGWLFGGWQLLAAPPPELITLAPTFWGITSSLEIILNFEIFSSASGGFSTSAHHPGASCPSAMATRFPFPKFSTISMAPLSRALLILASLPLAFPNRELVSHQQLSHDLDNRLTESEVIYGVRILPAEE